MTALSTAIGVHIESYFPTKTDTLTDVYEVLHNRILSPRPGSVTANCDSKIHIFHCASMPPDYLKTMKVPEKKDHFVPLMPPNYRSTEFKAPPLFSINLVQRAVSSSHETKSKSAIRFSGPGTKRKATILDHFSAKAAKSENFPCHKDSGNSPSCSTSLTCNVDVVADDSSDSHSISELQYDIGQHYLNVQSLSVEEKYNLLLNCSKLSSDFQCPLNTYGRKFLHSWLIDFPWLSYSKRLDGAFCFYCVLFASMENSHNSSKLVNLWKSPFTNWSNGPNRFRAHCEKSPLHRTATVMTSHFRQFMEHKSKPIDRQLNNMVDDRVSLNRGRLEPIVGGVIYF